MGRINHFVGTSAADMNGKKKGYGIMGKRYRGLFWTALFVALVVSLAGCGPLQSLSGNDEDVTGSSAGGDSANDGAMQVDTDLPFAFEKPLTDLPKDHAFTYEIGFDPETLPSMQTGESSESYSSAFVVFADSQFRKSVETYTDYDQETKELSIRPSGDINIYVSDEIRARHGLSDNGGAAIGDSGADDGAGWPEIYPSYYLVQYVDLQSGQPLEKPIVTQFSTVQSENLLETPMVSADVDQDGFAVFNWEKVEGAKGYYIVKYEYRSDQGIIDYTAIGYSEKTHWVSSEDDDRYLKDVKDHADNNWDIETQNSEFKCYRTSEDSLFDNTSEVEEDPADDAYEFGVIAVGDNQWSSYATIDTDALIARLPISDAPNANSEIYKAIPEKSHYTFDGIPATVAITMADGSTGTRVLLPDADAITDSTLLFGPTADEVKKYKTKAVATHPMGTMLYDAANIIEYDEATVVKEAERILARNLEEQPKTGLATSYEYTSTPGLDPEIIAAAVKETPQVPYPVNGTSPMVRHIAACTLAGEKYIDINAYLNQPGAPELADACDEALEQNPYILGGVGFGMIRPISYALHKKHGIVEILYINISNLADEFDFDDRKARQDALLELATDFAADHIKSDMSDEDKARAIVEYIAEKTEYDHDALAALEALDESAESKSATDRDYIGDYKKCWDPDGALVDGKAVCAGYAQAFKVLADASGLETVCVSGSTKGSTTGHQWNKVKIDEKWVVVDPTWIDTDPGLNWDYFGITDKQASRTQDNRFVVDFYVENYAAV